MAKVFYAILPLSNITGENLPTETAILKDLRAPENQNLLFFNSQEDAKKYCAIANQPKYEHDYHAQIRARKREVYPNVNWEITSRLPQTENYNYDTRHADDDWKASRPEEEAQIAEFDHLVSDPFFLSHQTKTSFAILEVELKGEWLPEDTHYIFSQSPLWSSEPHLSTPEPKAFFLSRSNINKLPKFCIECHKSNAAGILSLNKIYFPDKNEEINFSPQHQKLTLLRDYVLDPQPHKLALLQNLISTKEVHYLFKLLIEEGMPANNLRVAKDALFNAMLAQPQTKIQTNAQTTPPMEPVSSESASTDPTPPMSLKWKIAIGCTLGLAAISYATINYIQNHYDKNLSLNWKIAIGCTLGLAAIIYLNKHPQANTSSSEKNTTPQPPVKKLKKEKPKIVQKEFNLSEIQQGRHTFWKNEGIADNEHIFSRQSCSKKAESDYSSLAAYKERLQEKQNQPLSVNKCGELRKKVEFKDDNTIIVTGTEHQIHRLSLYATGSKEKCLEEFSNKDEEKLNANDLAEKSQLQSKHTTLRKALDKSKAESSNSTKSKKPF